MARRMKPALFLHIQKTAGTSVQQMARRHYGNDNVISHADYVAFGLDGCAAKAFVSGHFGYEFARHLMPGRYCFTFLRDPKERLLSLYRYCRMRTDQDGVLYKAARQYDLEGFLQAGLDSEVRSHLWNNQVWQLSYGFGAGMVNEKISDVDFYPPQDLLEKAKAHLASFDHVGLMETFDDDIRRVFDGLGVRNVEMIRSNVTTKADQNLQMNPRTTALVDEITELDRALYDHVFEQRAEELGQEAEAGKPLFARFREIVRLVAGRR